MFNPGYILLYVANPLVSAEFYSGLLGLKPIELGATFALFIMPTGLKFGLWRRDGVLPPVAQAGTDGELACAVESDDRVRELHQEWVQRGIAIAQGPERLDFGYAFTALDPDGHRLRVFCLAE